VRKIKKNSKENSFNAQLQIMIRPENNFQPPTAEIFFFMLSSAAEPEILTFDFGPDSLWQI